MRGDLPVGLLRHRQPHLQRETEQEETGYPALLDDRCVARAGHDLAGLQVGHEAGVLVVAGEHLPGQMRIGLQVRARLDQHRFAVAVRFHADLLGVCAGRRDQQQDCNCPAHVHGPENQPSTSAALASIQARAAARGAMF